MRVKLPEPLKKALESYRNAQFAQSISILEGQILHFRDSPFFYRLLGLCCLHTGDFGGSETYFQRALQLDPNDVESRLGMAYLQLKKGQSTKALQYWLEIIEENPKQLQAKKGLEGLRKHHTPENLNFWLAESKTKNALLPPLKSFKLPISQGFIVLGAFLVTFILIQIPWTSFFGLFQKNNDEIPLALRSGVELTDLSGLDVLTSLTGSYTQILTEKEIRDAFSELKVLFSNFKDNSALKLINKILLSNAGPKIKERVETLKTFFREPDFVNFEGNIAFAEVQKNPLLYKDCFVKWRGALANISKGTEKPLQMNLLVGYEEGKILEGIAQLSVGFAFKPEPGMAVEVLGKVNVDSKKWTIEVKGIHPIGLRKAE